MESNHHNHNQIGESVKTIIHVNQHKIRARHDSPLTVKTYKSNQEAATAEIVVKGEVVARIVYRPDDPISCGARVWIETHEEVRVTQPGGEIV